MHEWKPPAAKLKSYITDRYANVGCSKLLQSVWYAKKNVKFVEKFPRECKVKNTRKRTRKKTKRNAHKRNLRHIKFNAIGLIRGWSIVDHFISGNRRDERVRDAVKCSLFDVFMQMTQSLEPIFTVTARFSHFYVHWNFIVCMCAKDQCVIDDDGSTH